MNNCIIIGGGHYGLITVKPYQHSVTVSNKEFVITRFTHDGFVYLIAVHREPHEPLKETECIEAIKRFNPAHIRRG